MTGVRSGGEVKEDLRLGSIHARIGQTLAGRWTLLDVLGIGGAGSVYRARHRNGRLAAVKILHAELAANARVRKRFLLEGHAANRIGHPGVVAVLDDAEEPDGTVFLVMELLAGKSLAELHTECGGLSIEEVVRAAAATLDVLAAAHDHDILHRDVKPANVFVTTSGRIKVLDFGAARLREHEDFVTRSGTILGTPSFMAPEAAAGRVEDVDARSDLWSVGATMFLLLTGTTVHGARSANEALVSAATRPAGSVAERRPDLAPELVEVVDRALRFDKAERWPNARTMRRALLLAAGIVSDIDNEQTIPSQHDEAAFKIAWRFPRRGLLLWALAAALVIGLLLALGRKRFDSYEPPVLRAPTSPPTAIAERSPELVIVAPSSPVPIEATSAATVHSRKPPARPRDTAQDSDAVLDKRK